MDALRQMEAICVTAALACYAASVVCLPLKRLKRIGWITFAAGFAAESAGIISRSIHCGHVALQGLYDVFLWLSALMFILAVLGRRFCGLRRPAADALVALILITPVCLVFDPSARPLPPALQSPLFVPHVVTYMLAYVVLFRAGIESARLAVIGGGDHQDERTISILVKIGFPLLTAGLLLGAWWGHRIWGDFWNFDPKELWSLATWGVFAAYLHALTVWKSAHSRLLAWLGAAGGVCIIITLVWVNLAGRLFPSLHAHANL